MDSTLPASAAHAKINLGLHILRKRPDGYHDLETVFVPISLSDEIRIEPAPSEITVAVEGEDAPSDGTNLCVKAAVALARHAGTKRGARIHLRKNIPAGAGLGGGSSDAARVIVMLNELWDLSLPPTELRTVASSCGADVAYFVDGGIAVGIGRGDMLEPLPGGFPHWIVTAIPPEQVSTSWAYGQVRQTNDRRSPVRETFLRDRDKIDALERSVQNDFEPVVLPSFPSIVRAMELLRDAGLRCVRLSGSGSAVYGLTDSGDRAFRAAAALPPGVRVSVTPPYQP